MKERNEVRVIDNSFPKLVEEYLKQEGRERDAKWRKQKAREEICTYADVKDDYKGTMHITSSSYDVTAKFSLNEVVDTDRVIAICAQNNLDPLKYFNVKFSVSAVKSKEEGFELFAEAITTKPASPQIEIKTLEEK